MPAELKHTQLKNNRVSGLIDIKSTKDIDAHYGIIGQERAEKALKFGLNIKSKGYNIYVAGVSGSGKTTFATRFAREIAENEPSPEDLCYVYNFDNPKEPKLFRFPSGGAKIFKKDMEELIDAVGTELPKVFAAKEFETQKSDILKSFSELRDKKIKEMSEDAKKYDFGIKSTNTGIYFMPIVEGEAITEEQYDELNEEDKTRINLSSSVVSDKAAQIMRDIKDFERRTKKEIDDLEYSVSLFTVGRHIGDLFDKYAHMPKIIGYLKSVKEDILDNIDDFLGTDSEEEDALSLMLPWYQRKADNELARYQVNVITDNTDTKGAPVIIEHNPVYSNLVGDIEYDNE
ncbi:MAG: AAA family ATPase, partial [Clostridiales bacterium]|nr:AAA family ATPase [Clostridiales bacterium]